MYANFVYIMNTDIHSSWKHFLISFCLMPSFSRSPPIVTKIGRVTMKWPNKHYPFLLQVWHWHMWQFFSRYVSLTPSSLFFSLSPILNPLIYFLIFLLLLFVTCSFPHLLSSTFSLSFCLLSSLFPLLSVSRSFQKIFMKFRFIANFKYFNIFFRPNFKVDKQIKSWGWIFSWFCFKCTKFLKNDTWIRKFFILSNCICYLRNHF